MFKVKLYGAKEYWCQVPRIKQGFKGLGHEVVTGEDYDFIYANNFDYSSRDTEHKDSALYLGDSALPKKAFKIFLRMFLIFPLINSNPSYFWQMLLLVLVNQ